ncbi:prion-inhibition and propagation-domain-containing protein [Phaeosphaeriaceae sp. PMI808]|nr:prion-inhibition and propagation-domain-containing protein [Phaeosphaeriaceae sp. PMI808]
MQSFAAEIFGIVTGALNIVALFNNYLDYFKYIQLSRYFGRDYQTCQLRLDVAKDPRFATDLPADKLAQLAHSILEEVILLFLATYKTSKRYKTGADQQDLVLCEDDAMEPMFRRLHNRLRSFTRRRQKNTSLVKKTASLKRIVNQITRLVNDLESLFPTESVRRRLAEINIEGIKDGPSLTVLRDAASSINIDLSAAIVRKMDTVKGLNRAKDIKADGHAKIQVGHRFSETVLVQGIVTTDQTTNTVDTVAAKGECMIQIGSRFGGRTVLDD